MNLLPRRTRLMATVLAALAGYVDSTGFIKTGGFFVSFMSGNSTRLAVGLARNLPNAIMAGGFIAICVLGVSLGSLTGRAFPKQHSSAVLILVAALLAAAAYLASAGMGGPSVLAMALAMGAENSVFERDGEMRIGLTYMTGALVKVGQKVTAALMGGPRYDWLTFLLLWASLVAGALLGAIVYPVVGTAGLWIAAAVALGAAVGCWSFKGDQR